MWQLSYESHQQNDVRPAKTQISLGIRPAWSESSLCAQWVAKDTRFLHADRENTDQTGWMPRLIWVFAGRTGHFVGFVMHWLNYYFRKTDQKQLNIILQFPAKYPDDTIVTELTSKTLSDKLLTGLIKMCDEEAKKKLGQKQVG